MSHAFFGSKLNTILLLILIILMAVALGKMKEQKQMYLDAWKAPVQTKGDATKPDPVVMAKIKTKDNGPLTWCTIDDTSYYFAQGMVFDGSNNLYDTDGELVAECGGGWGIKPDPYPALCAALDAKPSCTLIEE